MKLKLRFKDLNGSQFADWKERRVDDVFDVTRGIVIAKTSIEETSHDHYIYPVYSSQTTNNGIMGYIDSFRFNGNYLTWTTDGANAGRVFARTGKFNCTNVCGVLVEKENSIGYANSYFAEALNKITPHHVSYVGNPKLMNNVMSEIKVMVPSFPEQKRISDFLTTFDQKIENQQEQISILEEMKKGVMQKIFSQEIRFRGGNGEDYPEWEERRLDQVALINPTSNELPDTFLYIDLESVENGILVKKQQVGKDGAPSRAQRIVQEKDILFQTVRPYQRNNFFIDKIGDVPIVASTGYAVIRSNIYPKFMYQLILADDFVNQVLQKCTGTSYPAINSNELKSLIINIPMDENESRKISDFLSTFDEKIEVEKQILTILKDMKKGFLQQMFV